jgi:hypothetical protein
MAKIKAYISHSIRGKMGVDATEEYMRANNEKAIKFGKRLANEFPTVDFYVPGEHDEFVLIAYQKKYLTEEQILEIDCDIVQQCNFLIAYTPDDYVSRGMQVEIDYAVNAHIPVLSVVDGDEKEYFKRMCHAINCQLMSMMR